MLIAYVKRETRGLKTRPPEYEGVSSTTVEILFYKIKADPYVKTLIVLWSHLAGSLVEVLTQNSSTFFAE